MNAARVAHGYDLLARSYDLLARAVYGNALRKAQSCFLPEFAPDADVLVLGGGSGWFLEALLRQTNPRSVVYVELSPKMLALAQVRIARKLPDAMSKVDFVLGRAEDVPVKVQFDWVVTHCLLDMFSGASLHSLIAHLKGCLRMHGNWYFSDFAQPRRWPMRWIARGLLWLMYRFFRLLCKIDAQWLPDFDAAFVQQGLSTRMEKGFFGGMIEAKVLSPDRHSQALK